MKIMKSNMMINMKLKTIHKLKMDHLNGNSLKMIYFLIDKQLHNIHLLHVVSQLTNQKVLVQQPFRWLDLKNTMILN